VLEIIDKIVIPLLDQLYGAVGYLGVFLAMTIESAMIPLPSELILPFAGFLISDPFKIEPLTGGAWNFWIVVVVATAAGRVKVDPGRLEGRQRLVVEVAAATALAPGLHRSGYASIPRF